MRRRYLLLLFSASLLSSTNAVYGQVQTYQVYDNTPGQRFGIEVGNALSNSYMGVPSAEAKILAYEFKYNHFSTSTSFGNTAIERNLDISNLFLQGHLLDSNVINYNQPLTLDILAKIGGFDHFGFIQTVDHLPTDVTAYFNNPSNTLPLGYYDPIGNAPNDKLYLTSILRGYTGQVQYAYPTDQYPQYYNEIPGNDLYYGKFTTTHGILFRDVPALPSQIISLSDPNDYQGFTTSLVGVSASHKVVESWSGIGTNMTWRSNTTFRGGGIFDVAYQSNLDPGDLPPVTGGGVYDIQTDAVAVPEPPSVLLLGCGLVAALHVAYRRRQPPCSVD